MEQEIYNIDDILKEIEEQARPQRPRPVAQPDPQRKPSTGKKPAQKKSGLQKALGIVGRIMAFLLVTVLLVAVTLYGVMYVLVEGPSPTARNTFIMSVRETSAVGFLANIFLTEDEIAQIESASNQMEVYIDDSSVGITIEKPNPEENSDDQNQGPKPDQWGLVDEDGDGIIVEKVTGEGYSGYMMVVLDPSRVIMGSVPSSYGARGYTVADMVAKFDAVAGINAGGFEDPDGQGNGSIPSTLLVFEGKMYYEGKGIQDGFVGFDSNFIMHTGKFSPAQIKEKDIQYGVSFGPALINNGVPEDAKTLTSGINPRTAIGQRSDGAVLMLVIDGRQLISLGARYTDLVDVFLEYGAVTACNLDGGSSTLMWYQGDYINNCASVVGIRPVPTTFLVLKEGVRNDG